MIGSLRGTVIDRSPRGELLVDVGGVGYRVSVTPRTLAASGTTVFLHVHTHVREDAIVLFGFSSAEERACFEVLLGAHGVGPGVALAILSTLTPSSLARAVTDGDVDALVAVPGIGRKTAARLIVDLAGRVDVSPGVPALAVADSVPSSRAEVQAALAGLGYAADEIRSALRDADDELSAEELLRSALRQMSGAG